MMALYPLLWALAADVRPAPADADRRQVRGYRHELASIDHNWSFPATLDDDPLVRTLEGFERSTLAALPAQTIVDRPAAQWMRSLEPVDLPVRWNHKTVAYLTHFKDDAHGRTTASGWLSRAAPYEARLRTIFKQIGVPEDLVMIAAAESSFNPRARSKVGAAGLWQFMEPTGAVYGLHRDYWVDDRLDIEKSTFAAAMYLRDLRVRFGSWELALAAYNAGYGLVLAAIRRHNTNNYWGLCALESGLPFATTNYVPKIIAAALLARNRRVFGIGPAPRAPGWVEVFVERSTSLKAVAQSIDVDAALLAELNAHLVRGRTPPGRGKFAIRIPSDRRARFEAAAASLHRAVENETTAVIRHGETLEQFAMRVRADERILRRLNDIRSDAELEGGTELIVPFGAPASVGATANRNVRSKDPAPPRPLAAVPRLKTAPQARIVFFVTTRATTPAALERAFDTPYSLIAAWNDLDPLARLQPDQVLQIAVLDGFDAAQRNVLVFNGSDVDYVERGSREHLEASLARRGKVRRAIAARRGDSLPRIGRRVGLSVGDLARINGWTRTRPIEPGELVIVYVDKGKTRGTVAAPQPRRGDDCNGCSRSHARN